MDRDRFVRDTVLLIYQMTIAQLDQSLFELIGYSFRLYVYNNGSLYNI